MCTIHFWRNNFLHLYYMSWTNTRWSIALPPYNYNITIVFRYTGIPDCFLTCMNGIPVETLPTGRWSSSDVLDSSNLEYSLTWYVLTYTGCDRFSRYIFRLILTVPNINIKVPNINIKFWKLVDIKLYGHILNNILGLGQWLPVGGTIFLPVFYSRANSVSKFRGGQIF